MDGDVNMGLDGNHQTQNVLHLADEAAAKQKRRKDRDQALRLTCQTLMAKRELEQSLFQLETIVHCAKIQLRHKEPDNFRKLKALLEIASDLSVRTSEKQLKNGDYQVDLLDSYLEKFATWR